MSEHIIDEGDGVIVLGGQDWDEIVAAARQGEAGERIVVNMGPQHPSTHGVLRLILEIEGETVTEARCGIGYLHTGIEKNMEYRTWTQGVAYVTRANYVASIFNEAVYCLGLCATAPSAMIDGRIVGRVDANRLDQLLKEAQS